MIEKLVAEYQSKAKAYLAGAVLVVVTAVAQAGAVTDVNELGTESWLKALGTAAVGALLVYTKPNKAKN